MELIGTKICNLVCIRYESLERLYSATIKCPYCAENVTSYHILDGWNTSNFNSHLTLLHSRGIEKAVKPNENVVFSTFAKTNGFSMENTKIKEPNRTNIGSNFETITDGVDESLIGVVNQFSDDKTLCQKQHTLEEAVDAAHSVTADVNASAMLSLKGKQNLS